MSDRDEARVRRHLVALFVVGTLLPAGANATDSTITPGATATPTPTATCAPTGTPYCSNNCVPCPTIRPDCYVSACGWCIQNPTCEGNEACVPTDNLNINGCCSCATVTPSPTTSATPAPPAPSCVGDCSGNAQVTVDDILTMVNIALGNADVITCDAGDGNQDGQITVDEILTAVYNALNGCPPPGTPTETPPATLTPTPWPSPTSCGVSAPVVNPVTSPTDLLEQVITGSARVTGARYLSIFSEAGIFNFDCYSTPPVCGSFAVPIPLVPNQTNHLTVCDVNRIYCGGESTIACTQVDWTGAPLEIVQISAATPTPTPTVLVYCTPPQCQAGEVFYCPGECPGGCGTQCGTPTPVPATSTATPTPSPTLAWTPSPTACGVETPLVDPIISPTNLVQQTITGTARLTGARFLEISSEAGAFGCDSPGSSCTAGSFAIAVALLPNQTNHLTVCEGNENYCGGPAQACTELDRNGNPLDIVQISGMPTPTATPTATCAPTGTPYCSNNCVPCPTIRPDCYVSACGWCIQNPTCEGNEACVPTDNLNINGCCSCATVTPTPTPPPPDTPTPTGTSSAGAG
jgi:hypothetical protein